MENEVFSLSAGAWRCFSAMTCRKPAYVACPLLSSVDPAGLDVCRAGGADGATKAAQAVSVLLFLRHLSGIGIPRAIRGLPQVPLPVFLRLLDDGDHQRTAG